jgi:potassium channel
MTNLLVFSHVTKVHGKIEKQDMFSEVGTLCDVPQLFTCHTAESSQLLRINKPRLTGVMHEQNEISNIPAKPFHSLAK